MKMPRFAIVGIWLMLTPLTLFSTLFFLTKVKETKYLKVAGISTFQTLTEGPTYQSFTALPSQIGGLTTSIISGDARSFILRNFLEGSPLLDYSDFIIAKSDEYDLDFRLIPAIAMIESGAGRIMPENSYNAWGFENGQTRFLSWENAIDRVAYTLRVDYIDKGLKTPEEIMPKYAPPSVLKGGPWARKVNLFLEQMNNLETTNL